MVKVSIIVPFQNVENYIAKCLTSLENQTLKDIEIICINDFSTDASVETVKEYAEKDNRIKLINTDKSLGQSHARNMGIDIAQGEYIGFVDSDDWVKLDMFEKMYECAKNSDTDITMCQSVLYDDKSGTVNINDYYDLLPLKNYGENVFNPEDTKDEILNINVVLWNKIYKRDFIVNTNIKFPDGYIYEDLPFFFETYLKAKRINILWERLYFYRQNRTHSTMQNSDKKVYDRIPMVELTYKILQKASFFEEKKPLILSWIIDDIFHRYTILEDKYYPDYYKEMQNFFRSIELTERDKEILAKSYCYDEFCNIIERSYFGFWNFLIEKYKTSNKRIKEAEHKCNLDIIAIKNYLEQYKEETNKEKEEIINWWQTHLEEKKQELQKETDNKLNEQLIYLETKKSDEMKTLYDEMQQKLENQEFELKKWQKQSLEEQKNNLTKEYEKKLDEQKYYYRKALQEQKDYYENSIPIVKTALKIYRKSEQIKNKIKKILKQS